MDDFTRLLQPKGLSIRAAIGEAILVNIEGKELLIHVKQLRGRVVQLIFEGNKEHFKISRIYSNAHED